jgi:UDP-3-O-[3-hydroxymyristoyl] glucosamine N-acyltransferase
MNAISASEIASFTGGKIDGDSEVWVTRVDRLEEATEGSLAFFANPKYESQLYESGASVVLVPVHWKPDREVAFTLIRTANPYYAFCMVLDRYFNPNEHRSGIDNGAFVSAFATLGDDIYIGSSAYVGDEVELGNNVKIYPQVYLGKGVKIGDNSILYPGVKVYAGCSIGSDCIIHAGTVIGSDGFGFAPIGDGSYAKIPQIGNVIIEDRVEIGANCAIDRATMGSTIIRKGVKLDNLIQVAHNAEIGANTVIAAQTGISGSTRLGERCMVGGQVGFVGHIHIAAGTQIGAQSGVQKAITEENQQWIGSPVMPLKEAFKAQVLVRNLPDLQNRIKELESRMNELLNKQ